MTDTERLFKLRIFLHDFRVFLLIFQLTDSLSVISEFVCQVLPVTLLTAGVHDRVSGGFIPTVVSVLSVLAVVQGDVQPVLQLVPRQPGEVVSEVVQVTVPQCLQLLLLQAGPQVVDTLPADVLQGGAEPVHHVVPLLQLLQCVVQLGGDGVGALLQLQLGPHHLLLLTPLTGALGDATWAGPESNEMQQLISKYLIIIIQVVHRYQIFYDIHVTDGDTSKDAAVFIIQSYFILLMLSHCSMLIEAFAFLSLSVSTYIILRLSTWSAVLHEFQVSTHTFTKLSTS